MAAWSQPTLQEMNSLVERLRALDAPVTILMEYTGHYHYPVLKKLQAEGFPVYLINPYQMKKYGDVEIHKAKTDKKDAVRIATYALEKAYKLTPYSAMEQKYHDPRYKRGMTITEYYFLPNPTLLFHSKSVIIGTRRTAVHD